MTTTSALGEVLDDIGCLAGQDRDVTPLSGGLTNHNYRVRTATHDVVVRVSPPSTGLLAVDREHEHANSCAAAAVGVGAPVVDYLPGQGVLVVEYLPSVTYADADVAANLDRVTGSVRLLHGAEPFQNRFDMVAIQTGYLAIVRERGFAMPDGYEDLAPAAERMRAALSAHPEALVPCHNDLLAANFLNGDDRLWIVDYEYSGQNEPSFELGNLAQECGLDTDQLAAIVEMYAGRPDPARAARAELWGVYAAYGWTLWGAIAAATSDVDFDFWTWTLAKDDTARRAFGSRWFGDLLDRVGGAA